MYNVLQDIENTLSVNGRGDTLTWTWVMSYLIVTMLSRKEEFHWDRFMFVKESFELLFFFPYCIQSGISPLPPCGLECPGLQTFRADLQYTWSPWELACWEGGRDGGGGHDCRRRGPMRVFLTTLFLGATSWNWKQRHGPRQYREG